MLVRESTDRQDFLVKYPEIGNKVLEVFDLANPYYYQPNPHSYVKKAAVFLESEGDVLERLHCAFPDIEYLVAPMGYDEYEFECDECCCSCYHCNPPPFSWDDIEVLEKLIG